MGVWWWDQYYENPYRCTHPDNPTELCTNENCPKNSCYSFGYPIPWFRNKEICNYVEKPGQPTLTPVQPAPAKPTQEET